MATLYRLPNVLLALAAKMSKPLAGAPLLDLSNCAGIEAMHLIYCAYICETAEPFFLA